MSTRLGSVQNMGGAQGLVCHITYQMVDEKRAKWAYFKAFLGT